MGKKPIARYLVIAALTVQVLIACILGYTIIGLSAIKKDCPGDKEHKGNHIFTSKDPLTKPGDIEQETIASRGEYGSESRSFMLTEFYWILNGLEDISMAAVVVFLGIYRRSYWP